MTAPVAATPRTGPRGAPAPAKTERHHAQADVALGPGPAAAAVRLAWFVLVWADLADNPLLPFEDSMRLRLERRRSG